MRPHKTTTYAEAFSMDAPPPENARTKRAAAIRAMCTLRVLPHAFHHISDSAAKKADLPDKLQSAYENALGSLNAMVKAKTFQIDIRRAGAQVIFRLNAEEKNDLTKGQARLLKEVVPAFAEIDHYLKKEKLQPHDDFLYMKERVDELVQALECVLKTSGKSR